MQTETPTLPDKLSDLITVALADLRACEKDPKYRVYMHTWHTPRGRVKCDVCLAGAVMAKRLNAPARERCTPECFEDSQEVAGKLRALNWARVGDYFMMLNELGVSLVHGIAIQQAVGAMPDYETKRMAFYRRMEKLASALKELGL